MTDGLMHFFGAPQPDRATTPNTTTNHAESFSGVVTDAEASRNPHTDKWEMKSNVQWKDGRMPRPGESFTLSGNPVPSLLEVPEDVGSDSWLDAKWCEFIDSWDSEHWAIVIAAVALFALKVLMI